MSAFEELIDNVDLGDPDVAAETPEPVDGGSDDAPEGEPVETSPAEALETTATPAGEPAAKAQPAQKGADTVPLAVHMDLKHRLREAAQRLATLEADRMMPAQQAPTGPAPKSPLEQFAEDEGADAPPTTQVLIQQRQWEQRQAQVQSESSAQTTAARAVKVAMLTMTDEAMGDGLGFDGVLQIGHAFLTPGDQLDVRSAGDKAGEVLYQRCLERAVRSGTPQGKLLAQAVKAARSSRTGRVVATGPKTGAKKTAEAPTREEILTESVSLEGAAGDLGGFFDLGT